MVNYDYTFFFSNIHSKFRYSGTSHLLFLSGNFRPDELFYVSRQFN